MIDVFISHFYAPHNNRAAHVSIIQMGAHQKILMKAFRICNESRIVFHAMCEALESIHQERRASVSVKLHISHHPSFKIIRNRYIYMWAAKGFKDAGKESHPDLFKRFVRLTDEFKHVGVALHPGDEARTQQAINNTMDVENLFEDTFWEKHHGMIMN